MTAALAVSLAALAFTIGSFWWLQARKGRLVAYEPQTYSGYFKGGGMRLRLPLTIYNSGGRTAVVTDLRLTFGNDGLVAPVITFRRSLKTESDDVHDFAHPFAVGGRQAVTKFVEFGRNDVDRLPETGYIALVEIRRDGETPWTKLVVVEFTSPPNETIGSYITHRRDPADQAPEPGAFRGGH